MRTLAQQPGGKFTPAVPTTGRGDVEISGRETFKENRAASLAEWRQLAA